MNKGDGDDRADVGPWASRAVDKTPMQI